MLHQRYDLHAIRSILIPQADFRPFPPAEERAWWAALPQAAQQRQVERAQQYLGYDWPSLPATLFLEYARNGNRERFQKPHFARRNALADLVAAQCAEGGSRFLDDIVNGVWALCEESWWGVPAHVHGQSAGVGLPDIEDPCVDLFAAETAALLAWTLYLLRRPLGAVSPLIPRRIELELRRRMLDPLLHRRDYGWLGYQGQRVNNWNPWICSNWLSCALLASENEDHRARHVYKILAALDNFIAGYGEDGGCDEGPGYWNRAGASLFDCLDLLHRASGGAIDVFTDNKLANIGRYVVRAHVAENWVINFADAPASVVADTGLLYRWGRRIGDQPMIDLGASAAGRNPKGTYAFSGPLLRRLGSLECAGELLALNGQAPLLRDVYLRDIQVLAARDQAGQAAGLYLAAKGGHNAESHNHNDIGQFIVYADGKPGLIDVGVEVYRRETFSSERYKIWTMRSPYHNLPTIDGIEQIPGAQAKAQAVEYTQDDQAAELALDIAGAYPATAQLQSWRRRIRLVRGQEVQVHDAWQFVQPAQQLSLSLMSASLPTLQSAGTLRLTARDLPREQQSANLVVHYDPVQLTARIELIEIKDSQLAGAWGDRLWRIILTAQAPAQSGQSLLRVMPG